MISYKPLFKTLQEKGITTYALIHKYNFSPSTINRLIKDQSITVEKVNELCQILDCDVKDVMVYIRDFEDNTVMEYLYDLIYTNGRLIRNAVEEFCKEITEILESKLSYTEQSALYLFLSLSINWLHIECNPDDITVLSLLKLLKCEIHPDQYNYEQTTFQILMSDTAKINDLIFYLYRHYREKSSDLPSNGLVLLDEAFQIYFEKRNIAYTSLLKALDKPPVATESEFVGKEKNAKLAAQKNANI